MSEHSHVSTTEMAYDHETRELCIWERGKDRWIIIPHNQAWDFVEKIIAEMRTSGAHPTFYMSQDEAFETINGVSMEALASKQVNKWLEEQNQ